MKRYKLFFRAMDRYEMIIVLAENPRSAQIKARINMTKRYPGYYWYLVSCKSFSLE